MAATASSRRTRPLAWLAAGLLVLAAGAMPAALVLPEWRAGTPPAQETFRAEYRRLARQAGFELAPGEPEVSLSAGNRFLGEVYRTLGERAPAWLAATRTSVRMDVSHRVLGRGELPEAELFVIFTLDGRPSEMEWENTSVPLFGSTDFEDYKSVAMVFMELMRAPGESLGAAVAQQTAGPSSFAAHVLTGSHPPQVLNVGIAPPGAISVGRRPWEPGAQARDLGRTFREVLLLGAVNLPIAVAAAGLFLALLLRARIDLVNGTVLALATLASAHPDWLLEYPGSLWIGTIVFLFSIPGKALWVFLVWSAGESLLRSTRPDFTTSLDTLRLGRIGPRVGRALILGTSLGAALAGLRFGLYAAAVQIPGVSPAASSLPIPVFRASGSPLSEGIALAAGVALALALAVRLLPDRWALPAAALLGGLALSPLALFPYGVELAVNVGLAGLLAWICRRFGLTTLLTATVVSFLLPALLASGLYLGWIPISFGIMAALTAAILLTGFAGLARPEQVETGYVEPPAFIRRLAEERRFDHEVDLLARMQVGLLPQEMPRVEGYDLAARSVLASEAGGDLYDFLRDEAGRLWIAAGDVAGHGYSCAIAQAMVKAGLVSLIAPEESPAGVLQQLDRVLRGVAAEHGFTSLALLRIDPGTGDIVLANAAYPYPLLFTGGRVTEIELPGLPLGHGPARTYADRAFHLPPRSALALCSDGLFEVLDRNGDAYGFERAREVLRAIGHRPAVEIVDALLNDCRRHVGGGELPDDVTVVVVRRG